MDRDILIFQHIEVIRKLDILMALIRSDFCREYSSFVPLLHRLHLMISVKNHTRKVLHRTILMFMSLRSEFDAKSEKGAVRCRVWGTTSK